MRGDDDGGAVFVQFGEQVEDFARHGVIDVAGGFVSDQEFRLVDDGAGDGGCVVVRRPKAQRPVCWRVA